MIADLCNFLDSIIHPCKTLSPSSLLTSTDHIYQVEILDIWNRDLSSRRPAIICQPKSVEEVSSIMIAYKSLLATTCPPLAVACSRHTACYFMDDAIVIDLSKFKNCSVDSSARTVTVEGGVKLGEMDAELSKQGLGAVTGTDPDTGVIGLSILGARRLLSSQARLGC